MSDCLAKMGAARVRQTSFHGIECIEKSPSSIVEFQFYQYVAPAFRTAGIAIPELLACDAETQTLTLEYIPHAMSQHELAERRDVLTTITRIHQYPVDKQWAFKNHHWMHNKTTNALDLLKLPSESVAIVLDIEKYGSCLFSPQTLISGDTNAGNWGIREQGDVVLYDWERFSTGSPAIDLAPLIKGMGNISDYIHIAKRYQEVSPSTDAAALAQEIAICKLWIVTEVLDILSCNHKADLSKYIDWYRSHLPTWLTQIRQFLG